MVDHDYDPRNPGSSKNTPRKPTYDIWANNTQITSMHQGGVSTTNRYTGDTTTSIGPVIAGTDAKANPQPATPTKWNKAYVHNWVAPDGSVTEYVLFQNNDDPTTPMTEFAATAVLELNPITKTVTGVNNITGLTFDGTTWSLTTEPLDPPTTTDAVPVGTGKLSN